MRYRDLLLDERCMEECLEWMRKPTLSLLVIESPHTGMGITTFLRCACEELDMEPIIVSTTLPKLKTFLSDACSSWYTVDFKRKILILDPLDAIVADPLSATELADFMKSGLRKLPIVVAGIRLRSSMSKLESMTSPKVTVHHIKFPEIDPGKAQTFLQEHCRRVGGDDIPVWNGDLRNALASIDTGIRESTKDLKCDGVAAVRRVLFDQSLTVREAIRLHDGDVSMIVAGTHENYMRTDQTIDACARMADAYSLADIMEEASYKTQRWDLTEMSMALSAGAPVAYLEKKTSKKYTTMDISKFGTIWSRNNNQRTKEKMYRTMYCVFAEQNLWSMAHLESLGTVRSMIMHAIERMKKKDDAPIDKCVQILKGLPNTTLLGIMRLWKSGYTQVHHSMLKKKRGVQ